jgi:hypothetical protein
MLETDLGLLEIEALLFLLLFFISLPNTLDRPGGLRVSNSRPAKSDAAKENLQPMQQKGPRVADTSGLVWIQSSEEVFAA